MWATSSNGDIEAAFSSAHISIGFSAPALVTMRSVASVAVVPLLNAVWMSSLENATAHVAWRGR